MSMLCYISSILLQVDIALATGTPFTCFHHHLIQMFERVTSKAEKRVFNVLTSTPAVLDYLEDNYGITAAPQRTSNTGNNSTNQVAKTDDDETEDTHR